MGVAMQLDLENTNFDADDDLSCYFCEDDLLDHTVSDGKLICKRVDDDTGKPFQYRAWEDVTSSEDSYLELMHSNGELAYKFKTMPPMVSIFNESNGLVMAHWKDNKSGSVFSHYVNPRGIKLYNKIKSDKKLLEKYLESIKEYPVSIIDVSDGKKD